MARVITVSILIAGLGAVATYEYISPKIWVEQQCTQENKSGHVKVRNIAFKGNDICLDCLHHSKWIQGYNFVEFETGHLPIDYYFNGKFIRSNSKYRITKSKQGSSCPESIEENRKIRNPCLVLTKVSSFRSPNVVSYEYVVRRDWAATRHTFKQTFTQKPNQLIARHCGCQYTGHFFFSAILNDMNAPSGFGAASCDGRAKRNERPMPNLKDFWYPKVFVPFETR